MIQHNRTRHCPVNSDDYVIYTTWFEDEISHVHLPMKSELINWRKINSYKVVKLTYEGMKIASNYERTRAANESKKHDFELQYG